MRDLRPHISKLSTFVVIVAIALAAAGCSASDVGGGPKSISEVETCLKEALDGGTVDVTTDKDKDKQVEDAVFATNGVSAASEDGAKAAPEGDFVMAIAANVREQSTVDEFEKDSKSFTETLAQGGSDKLSVESGSDDTYVWVVAGATGAEQFDQARDCVKP